MQGVRVISGLSELVRELSNTSYREMLNLSRKGLRSSIRIMRYLHGQYVFLKAFNYTKENIQAHLLAKASNFFGMEWVEDKMEEVPKETSLILKIKAKIRKQKTRISKLSDTDNQIQIEKNKIKMKNYFRPPS